MIYLLVNHQKIKFNRKIKNAIHDCNDEHNFEFLFLQKCSKFIIHWYWTSIRFEEIRHERQIFHSFDKFNQVGKFSN